MMRESLLKLVQFVSIMLYVLVAGVMWGTWVSLARTMTSYDAATLPGRRRRCPPTGSSSAPGGRHFTRCAHSYRSAP